MPRMTVHERRPNAADPKRSEGARLERASMRAYLRRRQKRREPTTANDELSAALRFVLSRQERYDRKAGGLGRR